MSLNFKRLNFCFTCMLKWFPVSYYVHGSFFKLSIVCTLSDFINYKSYNYRSLELLYTTCIYIVLCICLDICTLTRSDIMWDGVRSVVKVLTSFCAVMSLHVFQESDKNKHSCCTSSMSF